MVAGDCRLEPGAGEKGGSETGPSPVDRGRPGSKHHLLVDQTGIPLAFALTGSNRNDVTQLIPLLDAVPAVGGLVGRPRRRPDCVIADRGYDNDKPPPRPGARDQTGDRAPPDRARLQPRPLPLGRRAHLRLGTSSSGCSSATSAAPTYTAQCSPSPAASSATADSGAQLKEFLGRAELARLRRLGTCCCLLLDVIEHSVQLLGG
jgi:hypothetical protein